MTKLNDGEIEISLNGDTLVLKPTLAAIRALSRIGGGLSGVQTKLAAQDFDTVAQVIRLGAGMKDADAKSLDQRIYRNGLGSDLLVPLIRFVAILGNGGKPVDDDGTDAGDDAGGDRGGDAAGNA